jgi:hypothetical protein
MLDFETRREIVAHALRWAQNMVVEVISNHSSIFTNGTRDALSAVSRALSDACQKVAQDPGT